MISRDASRECNDTIAISIGIAKIPAINRNQQSTGGNNLKNNKIPGKNR
jgi:hypothetical protein